MSFSVFGETSFIIIRLGHGMEVYIAMLQVWDLSLGLVPWVLCGGCVGVL